MIEAIELIKEIGLPFALVFYLIVKFEKTIKANTDATNALYNYIRQKI